MSETAESEFETMREEMVEVIAAYALLSSDQTQKEQFDTRVMEAIARVPRHDYVPNELQDVAYANIPLPIGHGKTISQPFIVALMTDLLDLQEDDRILEIGTGLGYQAAILAELVDQVYTVEIIEELGLEAAERLGDAGYGNIQVKIGVGHILQLIGHVVMARYPRDGLHDPGVSPALASRVGAFRLVCSAGFLVFFFFLSQPSRLLNTDMPAFPQAPECADSTQCADSPSMH